MLRSTVAAFLLAAALPAAADARGTVSLVPASGPPGTAATLTGAGLPARRAVVVRVGRRVAARRTTDARGAFAVALALRAATAVTTRVGARTRTRNRFRLG